MGGAILALMKILHVIPGVAARYGGPSKAVLEMCRALQNEGTEILLLATNADGAGTLAVEVGRETVYEGVPALFFKRQASEAFKYSWSLARWLKHNVRRFELVHIHAVFSHSSLAAARACRRQGVPYILRPLGSLAPWSLHYKSWRKSIFWRLGVARMIRGAAALHYTTQSERSLAEQAVGAVRGVVIPLGITPSLSEEGAELAADTTKSPAADISRNPLPWPDAAPYILTLSRLHPVKGLEALITAFARVTQNPAWAHWKLVLAGAGEAAYVASLRDLAAQSNAAARIIFMGWLTGAEKKAALRGAEVLALTSHQENFGLGAAEALAAGVPVLLSEHVGLAAEVAHAQAGWVTPLAPEAFEATLATVLQNDDARRAKRRRALELADAYSWPHIARELQTLYLSCRTSAVKA